LLAIHENQPQLLRRQHGPLALIRAAIDPAVAVACLFFAGAWLEGSVGAQYLVLALVVGALTWRSALAA
jgi:hypothetical protein